MRGVLVCRFCFANGQTILSIQKTILFDLGQEYPPDNICNLQFRVGPIVVYRPGNLRWFQGGASGGHGHVAAVHLIAKASRGRYPAPERIRMVFRPAAHYTVGWPSILSP
jgi:hypothetical protein